MQRTTLLLVATTILALGATACSDSNPAGVEGTELTLAEQQALINALTTSGALGAAPGAAYASLAIGLLGEVGSISASEVASLNDAIASGIQLAAAEVSNTNYEGAVGIQIGIDIQGIQGWASGVVGWNGLSTETNSVDDLVTVFHYGVDGTMPPMSSSSTIGTDEYTLATYWDGSDSFYGISGTAQCSGSDFSGSNDCSQQGITCSYSTGTMNGSFDFEGLSYTTQMTYTQPSVSFSNLPAVRVMVSQ